MSRNHGRDNGSNNITGLLTCYLGFLSLVIAVLMYVLVSEPLATKIIIVPIVGLNLLLTSFIIFSKSLGGGDAGRSDTQYSQLESEAQETRHASQDQPITGGSAA